MMSINSSRQYNSYKHLCMHQQSPQSHEAKTDIICGRNRQLNNNSCRLQYPIFKIDRTLDKKEMDDLNKYINQLNPRDNRLFHPAIAENTFFLSIHRTFSSISHLLSHKTSFNTFRKAETILLVQSFIRSPIPKTRFSICTFTSDFSCELYVPTLFQFILLLRFFVDFFLSQPKQQLG